MGQLSWKEPKLAYWRRKLLLIHYHILKLQGQPRGLSLIVSWADSTCNYCASSYPRRTNQACRSLAKSLALTASSQNYDATGQLRHVHAVLSATCYATYATSTYRHIRPRAVWKCLDQKAWTLNFWNFSTANLESRRLFLMKSLLVRLLPSMMTMWLPTGWPSTVWKLWIPKVSTPELITLVLKLLRPSLTRKWCPGQDTQKRMTLRRGHLPT